MMNGTSIEIKQPDGTPRHIYIEPIKEIIDEENYKNTGVYKLYITDGLTDNKSELAKGIHDHENFLGDLIFSTDMGSWDYLGAVLSPEEQQQAVDYILSHKRLQAL